MKNLIAAVLLLACGSAQAALIDRGSGFIYDDVLDITWTQDANINGQDTWANQVAWAAGYSQTHSVYGTFDDWRLPTVTDTGTSGCNFAYSGTDCGYNVDTSTGEMASLFYDSLGNLAVYDTSGNYPQSGWGLTNTGPFTNLQSSYYWSGTEYAPDTYDAWDFSFYFGSQGVGSYKFSSYYALAVHDGDIAASVVPIPAAVWLFGSGLGLLGWMRRRQTA
ncbi:MAG: DUF1566 domain-containing protein [Gammaproteobacteria bacterium]|nr:DUF1566 domain-containing protein [Gammaproteobacteria bacterium]